MTETQEKTPFKVRTTDQNTLHSQHKAMDQAEFTANAANNAAEKLGIGTRYAAHDESASAS